MKTLNFINGNKSTYEIIRPQVNSLRQGAIEAGLEFTQGSQLNDHSMNVFIEGFEIPSVDEIINYTRRTNNKIGLILTEHIEIRDDRFFWNTETLEDPSEYMPQKHRRLKQILKLLPFIKTFITIGQLPALSGLDRIFPTIPVCRVPLFTPSTSPTEIHGKLENVIFFGKVTNLRRRMLKQISTNLKVYIVDTFLSQDALRDYVRKKRIGTSVSVPQNDNWKWESPIRTLMALELGLFPINIWPNNDHFQSSFAYDLELIDFQKPANELLKDLTEKRSGCFDLYEAGRTSEAMSGWQQRFRECVMA